MITGIGIDIVELTRVEEILARQAKFPTRVLTTNEMEIFLKLSGRRQIEYLAGRYAAKEAFSKAYGTGIGKELSFQDIEIDVKKTGQPVFIKPFSQGVHLSISHSKSYAIAQVIIERSEE